MLKKRIIPVLLWDGVAAVKGRGFKPDRRIGSMMDRIRIYERRGIDELMILDIAATPEGRGPRFAEIQEFTAQMFCPVTIGGGVRSVDDVGNLLRAGADKVAICSGAYDCPGLVEFAAEKYGRQAIVGAVDALDDGTMTLGCGTRGGMISARDWAMFLARKGAGEILLTSVPRDGTMAGYDLPLIQSIASAVSVPVVACGGAGTYQHMAEAFAAGAHAVAAGAMFSFTEQTPLGAARYLDGLGHPMRLTA